MSNGPLTIAMGARKGPTDNQDYSVGIGALVGDTNEGSVCLGSLSKAAHVKSVALGYGASTTSDGQLSIRLGDKHELRTRLEVDNGALLTNIDGVDYNWPVNGITSAIQTQLDSKASASHTHTLNDLSDCTITGPAAGDTMRFDGTNWVNTDLNVSLGRGSSATGSNSVVIGQNATTTASNAVVLGRNATTAAGELCIRVGNNSVTELKTGMGVFTYDSGAYNSAGPKWRINIGGNTYDIALIPV